jgi:hypothetical protein
MRMFACEAVDLDYLRTAPIRLRASVKVRRPPSEVFAFRVDGTTAPALHAWIKDYHFESDGRDGTSLRVDIESRPRLAFTLATPVLPRALDLVLTRAGHNLERGRLFSAPPSTS